MDAYVDEMWTYSYKIRQPCALLAFLPLHRPRESLPSVAQICLPSSSRDLSGRGKAVGEVRARERNG